MLETLERLISSRPFLRKTAKFLLHITGLTYTPKKKKHFLNSITKPGNKLPLDVTKRSGFNVFHNPGNTLITRGPEFELEVQFTIQALFFLDRQRGNTPVFADIGSNIGLHTLAVKEKFPAVEVIAFDPSPFSWNYLNITIRENNIKGIQLEPIALGSENGTVDFYTWGESSSGDSLRDTGRQPTKRYSIIQVPVKRFDDLPNARHVTVIKMDCEGAEVSILQGMTQTIKKNRPLIVTEFYEENQKAFGISGSDVYDLAASFSYSIHTLWFQKLNRSEFLELHRSGEENFVLLPNEVVNSKSSLDLIPFG